MKGKAENFRAYIIVFIDYLNNQSMPMFLRWYREIDRKVNQTLYCKFRLFL